MVTYRLWFAPTKYHIVNYITYAIVTFTISIYIPCIDSILSKQFIKSCTKNEEKTVHEIQKKLKEIFCNIK